MAEFTGERVIPGQVDADLLNEHLARYAFAARLSRRKQVLDAGCGAGYGSAELARTAAGVLGIDNAIALQMGHGEGQIYGYLRVPCRVEVNGRLGGSQERKIG